MASKYALKKERKVKAAAESNELVRAIYKYASLDLDKAHTCAVSALRKVKILAKSASGAEVAILHAIVERVTAADTRIKAAQRALDKAKAVREAGNGK